MAMKEYKVKIGPDVSQLQKTLKEVDGSVHKLTDKDFIISLDVDKKDAKKVNQVLDQIVKSHPELGIQFQYDVNKQALADKLKELEAVRQFQVDINTNKVETKIKDMAADIEHSFHQGVDTETLKGKVTDLYKYINTAAQAGVKVPKSIEALKEVDDLLGGYISKLQRQKKPVTLFEVNHDMEGTLERVAQDIEFINSSLETLRTKGAVDKSIGKGFAETNQQVDKTTEKLKELKSGFDEYYNSRKNLKNFKAENYWTTLQNKIDANDESVKQLLSDLKLLDENGNLKLITGGLNNTGGYIGSENVLVSRPNKVDENGNSRYDEALALKKALDEAYDSGVNVARIIDVIGDNGSETFLELQEKASGIMLGTFNYREENGIPEVLNADFLEATDEQLEKLIKDVLQLQKLGVNPDINPENIFYDKEKGFQLIDLSLNTSGLEFSKDMLVDDVFEGTVGTIKWFYEELEAAAKDDASGQLYAEKLKTIESFGKRFLNIAETVKNAAGDMDDALNKSTKKKGKTSPEPTDNSAEKSAERTAAAVGEATEAIEKEGEAAEESAAKKKKFADENERIASIRKPELYEDESGQISFIKDLASAEQELSNAMEKVSAEAKESSEQIEGQLSLDFSKAAQGQEKYELAISNTNDELRRMAEIAFRADTTNAIDSFANQTQALKAQALEEERIAAEAARRTAEIERQNAELEQQRELIRGAAETAFRMDTGQTGSHQYNQMLQESYRLTQQQVDETVRLTQAQMASEDAQQKRQQAANIAAVRDLAMQQEIADAQQRNRARIEATTTAIQDQTNAERALAEQAKIIAAQNLAEAYAQYGEELTAASVKTKAFEESLKEVIATTRAADAAGSSMTLLGDLQNEVRASDAAKESLEKLLKTVSGLEDTTKYTSEFVNQVYLVRQSLEQLSNEDIITPEQVAQLRTAVDELQKASKLDINKTFKELSRTKYLDQISKYLSQYTGLSKETRAEIEKIAEAMKKANSAGELKELYGQFIKLKTSARDAGEEVQSIFTNINHRLNDMNAKFIAQFLSWQDIIRYVRQAVNVIKELDYALVDLKKTTTMSTAEVKEFYYSANQTAKEMGVTTEEIINQAAAWSRLGYSSKEAATEMAALSSQFAQISPGMDVDLATDGLVSTMKAFHIDVADVETEVMDVINKTGNTMATTNSEIVEMLKRSSAAMSAANNSLKETIALESAAVQITRNAETTGTAFRTISMRIRGYDEETEEYIGGVEELTGKIADLTKTAKTPGGISLFTDETKTTYKSTYQILKDISEIYNELSDADQAALLENLAGKRGGQVLAGILEDFSEVERAMGNIEDSMGSADAEMSIVEESITYKLNNLQQTWIGILQELIDNGMLGELIDALTAISEVLGEIITTVGPVGTIIAGIGIKQLIVDADKLPQIIKSIEKLIIAAETANKVVTFETASESTAEVLLNIEGLEGAFGKVGTSAATATKSAGGLAKAFSMLGPILTNPITIMAALAAATYALYKWVDEANDRQRDKIKDLEKEYSSLVKDLDSTNSELERTNKQIEEIQSKGTISLVEQQELDNLRTQAELLKIARMEQENLLKLKAQELTGENKELFNNVYGDISSDSITNPEERIQGYDQTVGGVTKFSYGEQLSSALESAAKGDYNDSPNELLAIFQQIQEAREGALQTIEEYGSRVTTLNEEELAAFEGAKEVISDTDQYMSGLQIQIGKVKTELLNMRTDAARAKTDEGDELVNQIDNALKLVYQYSGTGREWNAMQIGSIFDNDELEVTKQELESLASAGELNEDTIKQYPKLAEEIGNLDLILGDGETAFSLFKNEMLASAEAAKQVDENLEDALNSAKSWEAERDSALTKLGLAKEGRDGIEYDESWTKYLETIKTLNPEIAENEKEVEKCALANLQFSHAIDDLSKNFKTYKEALKDVDALTPEFSDAINALADDLTYLTGINFSISEAADFLSDANNLELLEKAINGSDEALQKLQAHASQSIRIKIDPQSLAELRTATTKALQDVKNELTELGKGGNVDLTLRPQIDTQLLRDVGWDKVEEIAGEYATVFTRTFTNEAGDVAVNFTPIIVDENGNYVDVMEPDAFTRYCEEVIAGTRTDDLNLQIGAEFTGEHAVEEAEAAAIRIHNLHELQIELGLNTDEFNAQFTGLVNWLETADLGTLEAQTYINEDPFIQALVHLANESEEMAAKIKQIFSDLGWEITWDTKKMKVPTSQQWSGLKGDTVHVSSIYGPNGAQQVNWKYEEMDVPTNIHFERTSGSSSRRSSTSGYTPRSTSPAQKSGAASNIDKANGGGGGSNNEKEDDYKELIDYFERLIKTLDNSIDLLEAHLQDVVGSFAKNTLLDAQEDLIKKKMDGYASAIGMYSQKASEALSKIPTEVAAKIQNGAVAIDEFVGESNKDVVDAIGDYEQWADKVADCKQQIVELREELRQLELQKFKNVAQDFTELFDRRQSAIDSISKAISLFETASDKIVGRGFYDVSIDQTEKQLNHLNEERDALVAQMNSAIAAGINIAGDEWFEMLQTLEDLDGQILDSQKNIEGFKNSIISLYVDAFDRWGDRYSKQIELRTKAISALQKQISIIQESGNLVGESYIQEQITQTQKQLSMLQSEREELVKRMSDATENGVRVGTDEWYKMVDSLNAVDSAIQDCELSIESLDNAILALHTATFERIQSRFTSLSDEISNMTDMFSDFDVATKDNKWTSEGLAQLGLLGQQYEITKRRVEQYNEEIAELNKQYAAGKYSATEYAENLAKLKSSQWDQVKANKAARDSMISLNKARVDIVVEGINEETEAFSKLIEQEKKALSAEQDLHDYRKQIADADKSIVNIQRQLAALEGDNSQAATAKRLKLEQDLADAREELAEQEYSHSITTQQEALDQQLEDYQAARDLEIEALQTSLENEQQILTDTFAAIKENAFLIGQEILTMAQTLNITMSPEITAPWQSGENAIASYGALLNSESSNFILKLGEVESAEWRLQEQANSSSEAIANMFANQSDNLVSQTEMANEKFRQEEQDAWAASGAIANAFGQRADGLVVTIENARSSAQNLAAMSDALANSLSNSIDGAYSGASAQSALNGIADAANGVAAAANDAANALRSMMDAQNAANQQPKEHVTSIYGGPNAGKVAVWTDKNGSYKFRAKGSKSIPHDEIAWTQEQGPEMILSPTTGAILTPLQKGDAVLPTMQTSNIWEWSKFDPTEFASKLIQSVPNTGGNVQANTMQVGSLVTINGPVNDTVEMVKIASTTAATKIKQSFNELSNGLNK